MSATEETDEISKTAAKRKFLLTDEDLAAVPFKMKPNPMNKGYAPMKVYDRSHLERIAVEKHGSMEGIQEKKNNKCLEIEARIQTKDEETRSLWDCKEIYEPMKKFMRDIPLPALRKSQYFERRKNNDGESSNMIHILNEESSTEALLENDVVIHYFDCMHNRAKGAGSYAVHREFPRLAKIDQETPYNDRKKLGHFSWLLTDSSQLIVILYVIHKFPRLAANRPVIPVMNYDALGLSLSRLSTLLEKKLQETERSPSSLPVGTYLPYKADQTKVVEAFNKSFRVPVQLYTKFQVTKS